jgi:predicted nucleic acid-binding protein
MIVVDTNIIAYLHISGKSTSSALLLLKRDPYSIAPPLWQSEFRNVLVNYGRHDVMTLDVVTKLMEQALSTMQNREIVPSSELVLSLATNSNCSCYDCEFVALALETGAQLITADKRIVSTFPKTASFLEEFVK